jgi:ring-1,2-phenylacetyl-CoA epoxidase subunit PaaD
MMTPEQSGSMTAEESVWTLLETVLDPEIPVLSVIDLGIVRHVRRTDTGAIEVGVSPTYSGCPATEVIRGSIAHALRTAGHDDARVVDVLSPPWTSDWITPAGREKLRRFGIAPPAVAVSNPRHLLGEPRVACPRCASEDTERVSEFGSTPCKAHYRCLSCAEPFDYFKCI